MRPIARGLILLAAAWLSCGAAEATWPPSLPADSPCRAADAPERALQAPVRRAAQLATRPPKFDPVATAAKARTGDVAAMRAMGEYSLAGGERTGLAALSAVEVIPPPSLAELPARVAAGDAGAMFALADRYLTADGVELNVLEAHRLIERAFAVGQAQSPGGFHGPACAGICPMFFSALSWELPVSGSYMIMGPDPDALRRHAEKGEPVAMAALGQAYEEGRYYWALKADRDQAIYWYGRAAAAGEKTVLLRLGHLYGTSDRALKWYQRAQAARVEGAAQALAGFYNDRGEPGDAERSTAQWLKAARAGDPSAMDEVSQRYASGRGTRVEPPAARTWCNRAARALSAPVAGQKSNLGVTIVRSARTPFCADP